MRRLKCLKPATTTLNVMLYCSGLARLAPWAEVAQTENISCLIIKGSCNFALPHSFHTLVWTCFSERMLCGKKWGKQKTSGKWSDRWKAPEGVQCIPVRYMALTGDFFKLHAWQNTVRLWLFLLPVLCLEVSTTTGENNTLCFIGALWGLCCKDKAGVVGITSVWKVKQVKWINTKTEET